MASKEQLEEALRKLIGECWWVLSGGDNIGEQCDGCGCAGYGELRDRLKEAEALVGECRPRLSALSGPKEKHSQ